jgi:hypothetical protein
MAYDWSGNNIAQQRYDRIVLAVGGVFLLSLAMALPFAVGRQNGQQTALVLPERVISPDTWQLRL